MEQIKKDALDLKFNESCYNKNEKSSNEEKGNDESSLHGETVVDDEEISKRVNQLLSDYSEDDLDDPDVYVCVKCNNLYREQKDDQSIQDDQTSCSPKHSFRCISASRWWDCY